MNKFHNLTENEIAILQNFVKQIEPVSAYKSHLEYIHVQWNNEKTWFDLERKGYISEFDGKTFFLTDKAIEYIIFITPLINL